MSRKSEGEGIPTPTPPLVAGRYHKGKRLSSTLYRFLTLGIVVAGADYKGVGTC